MVSGGSAREWDIFSRCERRQGVVMALSWVTCTLPYLTSGVTFWTIRHRYFFKVCRGTLRRAERKLSRYACPCGQSWGLVITLLMLCEEDLRSTIMSVLSVVLEQI